MQNGEKNYQKNQFLLRGAKNKMEITFSVSNGFAIKDKLQGDRKWFRLLRARVSQQIHKMLKNYFFYRLQNGVKSSTRAMRNPLPGAHVIYFFKKRVG